MSWSYRLDIFNGITFYQNNYMYCGCAPNQNDLSGNAKQLLQFTYELALEIVQSDITKDELLSFLQMISEAANKLASSV